MSDGGAGDRVVRFGPDPRRIVALGSLFAFLFGIVARRSIPREQVLGLRLDAVAPMLEHLDGQGRTRVALVFALEVSPAIARIAPEAVPRRDAFVDAVNAWAAATPAAAEPAARRPAAS